MEIGELVVRRSSSSNDGLKKYRQSGKKKR